MSEKDKRKKRVIVLVKRGNCWFHEKAINAQAMNSFLENYRVQGIVIGNDHRPM